MATKARTFNSTSDSVLTRAAGHNAFFVPAAGDLYGTPTRHGSAATSRRDEVTQVAHAAPARCGDKIVDTAVALLVRWSREQVSRGLGLRDLICVTAMVGDEHGRARELKDLGSPG